MVRMIRLPGFILVLFLATLLGCSSYRGTYVEAYRAGNFPVAAAQLERESGGKPASANGKDRLLFLLEQGAILRTAGDLEGSNAAFDAADRLFQHYDEKARTRLGREAVATFANLAEVPYEGYGYDRIMMNAYKALNYMEQGNDDFARAELKRIAYAQQLNETRKAARIADAQAAARQKASDIQLRRSLNDPRLSSLSGRLIGDIAANARAVYVNAFAEYLQGIYYLHCGDSSDQELARAAFRSTCTMSSNAYAQQDLQLADAIAAGAGLQPITYVIFESGVAPRREEIRIDVPIWYANIAVHDTGVDYVGAAFPRLVPTPGAMPGLTIQTATERHPTQLLVDVDAVVAKDFEDELPTVITRTLISAAAKASAAYAAHRATRNDELLNTLTRIGTTVLQYSLNRADLRTWRTLPKWIVIARFPTPADGTVYLNTPAGQTLAIVQVIPDQTNIVWVRGPSDTGAVAVRTFPLQCKGDFQ